MSTIRSVATLIVATLLFVLQAAPAIANAPAEIVAAVTQAVSNYSGVPALLKNPHVRISRSFALLTFDFGEGGGSALLKRTSGRWKIVVRGGGIFNEQMAVAAGIDAADARYLFKRCALPPPKSLADRAIFQREPFDVRGVVNGKPYTAHFNGYYSIVCVRYPESDRFKDPSLNRFKMRLRE